MSDCCEKKPPATSEDHCQVELGGPQKIDKLLWGTGVILFSSYLIGTFLIGTVAFSDYLVTFSESVVELINRMWWGLLLGIVFVGILDNLPEELLLKALGPRNTFQGIIRATLAGVLLDLCSHGILIVGMKLYKKGASLGQTMAFLIASPWNSFSLTLVLWALVGFWWMLAFLGLSLVIALISGVIFNRLESSGVLPQNPNQHVLSTDESFMSIAKRSVSASSLHPVKLGSTLKTGFLESRMILRWIFLGVVLASLMRTFLDTTQFQTFFGPTVGGLGLTLVVATILEVCSEGSTPIAADILTRAGAPGNAFGFLMTGVSTDYTEILSLKETTGSWKIAFFLPLVTLPQIITIAILMNVFSA